MRRPIDLWSADELHTGRDQAPFVLFVDGPIVRAGHTPVGSIWFGAAKRMHGSGSGKPCFGARSKRSRHNRPLPFPTSHGTIRPGSESFAVLVHAAACDPNRKSVSGKLGALLCSFFRTLYHPGGMHDDTRFSRRQGEQSRHSWFRRSRHTKTPGNAQPPASEHLRDEYASPTDFMLRGLSNLGWKPRRRSEYCS